MYQHPKVFQNIFQHLPLGSSRRQHCVEDARTRWSAPCRGRKAGIKEKFHSLLSLSMNFANFAFNSSNIIVMTTDYFRNRHTVRQFSSKPVPDSLLKEIFADAMHAPTCGGMQLYTAVVNRQPETLKEMAALHFNQPAAVGAKAMVTVCADFNRMTRWCRVRNADAGYDNLLSLTNAMADAFAFAQQFITAAEMRGLGVCWLGTATYNAAAIADMLHLPPLTLPVCTLAIGWPEGVPQDAERLPEDAVLVWERYPDWSDKDIEAIHAEKESLEVNKGYVKENGLDNLAQVFAQVRYPRSMNESASASLSAFLSRQHFL